MTSTPKPRGDGRIVIVGDVMLDRYLLGSVDRMSPEAPVPVLRQMTTMDVAGGAANVAMNASALGGQVALFGVVGDDDDARDLRHILQGAGLSTDGLLTVLGRPTTTKTRVVAGRQQIVRFDSETTVPILPPVAEALIAAASTALDGAAVLVLSDYLKGTLTDSVITGLIASARARGAYVVVDPKRSDFSVYCGADLIKPNRRELAAAAGLPADSPGEIDTALAAVRAGFDGAVLVTRAEDGMTLAAPGRAPLYLPVGKVRDVADVSGAGDTALAALAVALAEGRALDDAAARAIAASSLAVAKPGTAIVHRAELDAALATAPDIHAGTLVDRQEARRIVAAWRATGEAVVFTNGCFDIVHPGHVHLLAAAAAQGRRLVVALNTDRSVSALKGPSRPVQNEAGRAAVIGALRFVDLVVLFDEDTPLALIDALEPDVLVKGADYREDQVVGGDLVRSRGGKVVLIDLIDGQSSTRLIEGARAGD